jgi:hypothetical protein
MSTSTHTPRRAATVRISAQRDRVARALLIVAAFGAAIATVGAIGTASDADAATRVVETWRLLGLSVFTGLFVLLAYRPRYYAGVWELAIANKFALAAFGIAYGANATDARQILAFDGQSPYFSLPPTCSAEVGVLGAASECPARLPPREDLSTYALEPVPALTRRSQASHSRQGDRTTTLCGAIE